ncbi:MAG TPA: endolytic transglycosylase MltG [Rhizomicrobium sp.]|nr:endolytic transglycosylase MltG [Rhizomicrobium sp.]
MKRFLVFLILLAIVVGGAWFWEQRNFSAPGPAQNYTVVTIKPGDHVATIAQKLADAGVIANADLFRIGLRIRGTQSDLKAGEYGFPAHASMADAMGILVLGKSIEHKITAAEGLTSQMIANIVESDTVLTGSAGPVPAEGTLLPETYLFTRGMTRAQMLANMHKAQVKFLNEKWAGRQPDLPVKTREQAIILASVVEKETGIPEERRHIASVFENRLRLGMKLQSDPTIIYGITKGYPLGHGIRQSELASNTPYNTYIIPGLPPTPICNPGKDAIAAVLNPEQTNDLYFVATGHGGHVFTPSLAAHLQNVAKLRQTEQGR